LWFIIISYGNIEIEEDGSSSHAKQAVFYTSNLIFRYIMVMSVILSFQTLQLMKYFSFSAGLSMFYEIIGKAMIDLCFFIIIFVAYI